MIALQCSRKKKGERERERVCVFQTLLSCSLEFEYLAICSQVFSFCKRIGICARNMYPCMSMYMRVWIAIQCLKPLVRTPVSYSPARKLYFESEQIGVQRVRILKIKSLKKKKKLFLSRVTSGFHYSLINKFDQTTTSDQIDSTKEAFLNL
jgi:hypothetical protein